MSIVILRKTKYDYNKLKPQIFEILDFFCGDLIKKNSRVVIKPNLLTPASPDRAILTHPLVVKASVEYVLQKGARPQISDSPGTGSFEKILKESSIRDALTGVYVDFKEFKTSLLVDIGEPFKQIEIGEDALKADVLINLPKLKTHTQMLLTLGVKNLFGCIVGLKKPEWHFRTGVDREMFAKLLVKIYKAVNPTVTILDGILAMEGQGPGRGGIPRELGVLIGSNDTVAIDFVVCKMIGIDPDRLLTNKVAKEMGFVHEGIDLKGDQMFGIEDFKLPQITPLVFGPKRLHRVMRKHLVQRPVCDDTLCELCEECLQYCPANAISQSRKKIHFDYDSCIRCYCCIEVCPHGAFCTEETLLGKIVRKVLKLNK
ncbi:MAG: DUF362 domain-containing protein [Nitrospirota bacterium]|nr:DUF362 domain-containing protein [Nitrospirota bacterium]MDH5767516.1 DUF362 domain-containing protein [Nitrospirota bacterium]